MPRRIFIGDKVKTTHGIGYVESVVTWRDRLLEMDNDYEAEEFCAACKAECGVDFKSIWVQLTVSIGRRLVSVQAKSVELLEGRDVVKVTM